MRAKVLSITLFGNKIKRAMETKYVSEEQTGILVLLSYWDSLSSKKHPSRMGQLRIQSTGNTSNKNSQCGSLKL